MDSGIADALVWFAVVFYIMHEMRKLARRTEELERQARLDHLGLKACAHILVEAIRIEEEKEKWER